MPFYRKEFFMPCYRKEFFSQLSLPARWFFFIAVILSIFKGGGFGWIFIFLFTFFLDRLCEKKYYWTSWLFVFIVLFYTTYCIYLIL
jgi:hypothetical protein